MNEQFPLNQPTGAAQNGPIKKAYWKFVVVFLGIIAIAAGGFFVWDKYFSAEARLQRQTQENYQKYLDWQKNYEAAMKTDTYGGKTPEETLNMFIDALKKGDVELASRYFMLRDDGGVDPKWKDALTKLKEANMLTDMITSLSSAKSAGSSMQGYWGFEIKTDRDDAIFDINLQLNKFSGVWKIESM